MLYRTSGTGNILVLGLDKKTEDFYTHWEYIINMFPKLNIGWKAEGFLGGLDLANIKIEKWYKMIQLDCSSDLIKTF